MNLMDKIYRALEAGTKCNQLYRKESLVLLMQKESIPMHMLSGGESQAMMAEEGLSNITVPDFQVVTDKDFISLPIVYGQAIKQILQNDLRENEKQQDMTMQSLEEACLQLMTEYAEERFEHAMKIMPDGSRFYPVKLHPANWKDHLESGFSNIDRMQSSQMYMEDYVKVFQRRERAINVLLRYGRFMATEEIYEKIRELQQKLGNMCPWLGMFKEPAKVPDVTWERLQKEVLLQVTGNLHMEKQQIYEEMIQKREVYAGYEESIWECIQNTQDNSEFLREIKAEIKVMQKELSGLRTQIQLSMMKDDHEPDLKYNLLPHTQDDAYEAVIVTGSLEELYEKTSLRCEDITYVTGLNALFAGEVPFGIEERSIRGHLGIEIGFLARRLEIEREWFLPQALQRFRDSLSVSYPNGLVIAKDITLRFIFDEISKPMIPVFVKCIHQYRGFLCFHEQYQNHKGLFSVSGNTLTCQYDWPQLAGYYMTQITTTKEKGGTKHAR